MQNRSFFMRDQLRHGVDEITMESWIAERTREHGGTLLAAFVVVLTVLNVLAVTPSA
jgi:hypothetical protein